MKNLILYILGLAILTTSCNKNNKESFVQKNTKQESSASLFPQEKNLNEYKNTDFVFALEKEFPKNKNIIYSPTVLFAWEELKKVLNSQVLFPAKESNDFHLLNHSNTFQNVLERKEFEINVDDKGDDGIKISSYFKKLLPFKTEFQKIESSKFKEKIIKSFGIDFYDEELVKQIKIINYKNDNDFIIKLLPKNKEDEIILVKTKIFFKNFRDVLLKWKEQESSAIRESKNPKLKWRTEFLDKDQLHIPYFSFNINKSFSEFSNLHFKDIHKKNHFINSILQRNAFVLDETGAKAESEAIIMVDSASADAKPLELPKPKKLFFNDDFYIFLKKKNKNNPYFAIKIVDTELMNLN